MDNKNNTGVENTGDLNSGSWNSGDWNSGNRNSGYLNSGDLNSGNQNSGYRNSGNWNSGDRNSGYFNSNTPTCRVFGKDSGKTHEEIVDMIPPVLWELVVTEWVPFSKMTDEEKKVWPEAEICDGYLKTYEYKQAWANLWKRVTAEDVAKIKALPNFDAVIFEEITGIKISEGDERKTELLKKADELLAKAHELRAEAEKF